MGNLNPMEKLLYELGKLNNVSKKKFAKTLTEKIYGKHTNHEKKLYEYLWTLNTGALINHNLLKYLGEEKNKQNQRLSNRILSLKNLNHSNP